MKSIFHLAYHVTDLNVARYFYGEILGCHEGRSAESWGDFDLFGHQISLHVGMPFKTARTGLVGDHKVPMPHLGVILEHGDWEKLAERLRGLMQRYPLIGDVRGKGLLTAFELMTDRTSKAPLPAELNAHARLVDIAYDNGLIIYSRRTRGGTSGDHFLVCPPMIVTEPQLDEISEILDASLAQYMAEIPQYSGAA